MPHIATRRELSRRKTRFRVYAGLYDFLSTIAGGVVLLFAVILLVSLVNWIIRDGRIDFSSLIDIFRKAVIG